MIENALSGLGKLLDKKIEKKVKFPVVIMVIVAVCSFILGFVIGSAVANAVNKKKLTAAADDFEDFDTDEYMKDLELDAE